MREASFEYVYFNPEGEAVPRQQDRSEAMRHLGERVASGWETAHWWVRGEDGKATGSVTAVLSGAVEGRVWALYIDMFGSES